MQKKGHRSMRFDHCDLWQDPHASVASPQWWPPLLGQLVANMVAYLMLWQVGSRFRKSCRYFRVKTRIAYLAPVLRCQENEMIFFS